MHWNIPVPSLSHVKVVFPDKHLPIKGGQLMNVETSTIVLVLIGLAIVWGIMAYNRFVKLVNLVKEAWSGLCLVHEVRGNQNRRALIYEVE